MIFFMFIRKMAFLYKKKKLKKNRKNLIIYLEFFKVKSTDIIIPPNSTLCFVYFIIKSNYRRYVRLFGTQKNNEI